MNYRDTERLNALKSRFEVNYRVSRLYARYLENCPELITKEMMSSLMDGARFSEREGIIALLTEAFGLKRESSEDLDIIKNYLTPSVSVLDTKKYEQNPYYKNIRLENIKDGRWEVRLEKYDAYRAFVCGDMVLSDGFYEYAPLGFFKNDFYFPAVLEDENEWMTLTPVDVDTCDLPIERAHGKVVTFGLGLGYFAYMASNKPEVSSVTVVEKSETIIELFKKHILSQFENKDKIEIVNSDAFEYAEFEMPKMGFDYAFVDTWRDASDGAPMYKKMKALEGLSQGCKFDYWVENFLISRLRAEKFEKLLFLSEKYQSYEQFASELSKESLTRG